MPWAQFGHSKLAAAVGAYANRRLTLAEVGKAQGRNSGRDSEPDLGKLAVRDYRGASGNVAMVEMCTHLAIERARKVTLHLQQARRSSIPTKK